MSAVARSLGRKEGEATGRRISGRQDKLSFFVIFLIGVAGILLLSMYFRLPEGYVIGWPVACMLIYLALITSTDRYRLRPDQAGDNLYYLGFLYTLVSLSVALYGFTSYEAAGENIENIISNFGIALATTILGIALRVMLHQMREDPVDTEREARQNLAEAANRLRAELDTSVRDMSSFGRQMRQSIEEALHDVSKKSDKLLEESGGRFAEATKTAGKGIEEALSTFSKHTKALNDVSGRQVEVTKNLIERIESIEVPMNLMEDALKPAFEELDKELRKIGETGADRLMDSMQILAERQAYAFSQITHQVEETLTSLQKSRQEMEKEVERARSATTEVMQELKSMVQILADELGSSNKEIRRRK